MSPLEQRLAPDMPYAVRYAACVTRGLPIPKAAQVAPDSVPREAVRALSRVRLWTEAEDAIVRAEYPNARLTKTIPSLAHRLRRTTAALMLRAVKLRVAEVRPWQGREGARKYRSVA